MCVILTAHTQDTQMWFFLKQSDVFSILSPLTYIADNVLLWVSASLVEGGEKRLQMLGTVVLGMKQQHIEKLRSSDPCGHQPVGYIVGNGRHKPTKVSYHQLSTAQPWTLHCIENEELLKNRKHVFLAALCHLYYCVFYETLLNYVIFNDNIIMWILNKLYLWKNNITHSQVF